MKKMTPFLGKGLWRRGITIEKDGRTIFVWEHAEPWNWSNSAFLPFGVEFHGVPIMHTLNHVYPMYPRIRCLECNWGTICGPKYLLERYLDS